MKRETSERIRGRGTHQSRRVAGANVGHRIPVRSTMDVGSRDGLEIDSPLPNGTDMVDGGHCEEGRSLVWGRLTPKTFSGVSKTDRIPRKIKTFDDT